MSRISDRAGTKLSAKINPGKVNGPNKNGSRYGSWFGRRYGKTVKK